MIPRENPQKDDFERFYEEIDPWKINGNIITEITVSRLRHLFSQRKFQTGIDLGCGEGIITSRLDFVKDWTAYDISENAINRAKEKYPAINFAVMDINWISYLTKSTFDFLLCLETIYYLSPDQRLRFLRNLKLLGTESAYYCIGLVVSGPSQYRDYPTFDEAYDFLSEFFIIERVLPISVKDLHFPKIMQYIFKLEKLIPLTSLRKSLYIKYLKETDLRSAHQALFILRAF
jgi:hypothetical protein